MNLIFRKTALAVSAGCLLFVTALEARQQMSTDDGVLTLTIPANWDHMELNPVAQVQIGNVAGDAFTMVINESNLDMVGWNLTRHSIITLARILTAVDSPVLAGPDTIEVSGYPAVQYKLSGASEGTRIIYMHTTVEGPSAYSQVLQWTTPSRWVENGPILLEILNSIEIAEDASAKLQ